MRERRSIARAGRRARALARPRRRVRRCTCHAMSARMRHLPATPVVSNMHQTAAAAYRPPRAMTKFSILNSPRLDVPASRCMHFRDPYPCYARGARARRAAARRVRADGEAAGWRPGQHTRCRRARGAAVRSPVRGAAATARGWGRRGRRRDWEGGSQHFFTGAPQ